MKDHKLRVLWNSNAPWCNSGYAQQNRQILPRMRDEGFNTGMVCFYGLEGGILKPNGEPQGNGDYMNGITFYPKIADQWGSDAIIEHGKHFNADVVLSLQDTWVLNKDALKEIANIGKKWIPWIPIDHEPVPPAVMERVRLAYRVIAMSPFGQRELQKQGIHSTYIPHGVETGDFHAYDKSSVRRQLGIPEDLFIFGMVAANKDHPPRKSFQHVMDAFARFHQKHPKSALYLHTLAKMQGGFQIEEYAANLGISGSVFITPAYKLMYEIPAKDMAALYSAFDCLLCPSLNEGFGVPIIEAQSCEVPVIVNNFTSMPDLVIDGKTGFVCDILEKRFTPLGSYVGVPSTDSLYGCMEKMFETDRVKMGKDAREFIIQNFDTDMLWRTKWLPFFEKLECECYPGQVDTPNKQQ